MPRNRDSFSLRDAVEEGLSLLWMTPAGEMHADGPALAVDIGVLDVKILRRTYLLDLVRRSRFRALEGLNPAGLTSQQVFR